MAADLELVGPPKHRGRERKRRENDSLNVRGNKSDEAEHYLASQPVVRQPTAVPGP